MFIKTKASAFPTKLEFNTPDIWVNLNEVISFEEFLGCVRLNFSNGATMIIDIKIADLLKKI